MATIKDNLSGDEGNGVTIYNEDIQRNKMVAELEYEQNRRIAAEHKVESLELKLNDLLSRFAMLIKTVNLCDANKLNRNGVHFCDERKQTSNCTGQKNHQDTLIVDKDVEHSRLYLDTLIDRIQTNKTQGGDNVLVSTLNKNMRCNQDDPVTHQVEQNTRIDRNTNSRKNRIDILIHEKIKKENRKLKTRNKNYHRKVTSLKKDINELKREVLRYEKLYNSKKDEHVKYKDYYLDRIVAHSWLIMDLTKLERLIPKRFFGITINKDVHHGLNRIRGMLSDGLVVNENLKKEDT